MAMKSIWKVSTQWVNGRKMFQVYRILNVSEFDHAGNREYAEGMFATESLAKEEAARKNGYLKEDKAVSTQKLFEYMKTCRQFEDLEKLEYVIEDNKEEFVIGTFKSGYQKKAYVTGDSCLALGMDTLRLIGY